jgi:hypothetical protein
MVHHPKPEQSIASLDSCSLNSTLSTSTITANTAALALANQMIYEQRYVQNSAAGHECVLTCRRAESRVCADDGESFRSHQKVPSRDQGAEPSFSLHQIVTSTQGHNDEEDPKETNVEISPIVLSEIGTRVFSSMQPDDIDGPKHWMPSKHDQCGLFGHAKPALSFAEEWSDVDIDHLVRLIQDEAD